MSASSSSNSMKTYPRPAGGWPRRPGSPTCREATWRDSCCPGRTTPRTPAASAPTSSARPSSWTPTNSSHTTWSPTASFSSRSGTLISATVLLWLPPIDYLFPSLIPCCLLRRFLQQRERYLIPIGHILKLPLSLRILL